jgi:peptide/nickel transport system substrate-binding protein
LDDGARHFNVTALSIKKHPPGKRMKSALSVPFRIVSICAVALMGVVAAVPPSAADPVRGGTFVYSVTGEPETYDCHASPSVAVQQRLAPHYSLLVKIDPAHYPEIAPDLAASWSTSSDGTTYTFKLRPNIKFHDGSALTSADVKATFDRIRNPPQGVNSLRKGLFADVTSIETPDASTVVFKNKAPDPVFLLKVASPWNCVYSAKLLQTDPTYPAKKVMGTGPFKFVSHSIGAQWVGTRFDDYFLKGQPYLDGFQILDLAGAGLINALTAGQTMGDFRGVAPKQRDIIKAARGDKIRFYEGTWSSVLLLSFNTTKKPFDDARVRRALSLAIDRWSGVGPIGQQTIFGVVGGFLFPGSKFARSEEALANEPGFKRDMAANRAEAKRLLAEAGVSNLSFTLNGRAGYTPVSIYLIDQWRQIGVTVKNEEPENAVFFNNINSGAFDATYDAVNEYSDDPAFLLNQLQSYDRTTRNYSRFVDHDLDAMYDKLTRSTDPAERVKVAQAFEERLLTQAYTVPLFWGRRIVPMASDVEGFHLTPSYYLDVDLAGLWIKK